jgi:hypothetical protein
MDSSIKSNKFQVKYLLALIIVLIILSFGGYYLYVKNGCTNLISTRNTFIKGGEMYVQLEYENGDEAQYVKSEVFKTMCMDKKL